jgi:ABC-type Fe3+-hydroxamate transport system substrate-binding protein
MTTTTVDRTFPLTDVVDSITRRELLGMIAAAGLLAACGDDNGESASGSAGGDATRSVRVDSGTVDVPADPERVVAAIGSFETDMVAVGVMPVLTTSFERPPGRQVSPACGQSPSPAHASTSTSGRRC